MVNVHTSGDSGGVCVALETVVTGGGGDGCCSPPDKDSLDGSTGYTEINN